MKNIVRKIALVLAVCLIAVCFTACGAKEPDPVNTKTCTYDEMVNYLKAKGFIAKDAKPVDINTTPGYVKDNTGGEIPCFEIADKAEDFGGLYLFFWDGAKNSQLYQDRYENAVINGNTVVYMGGACVMSLEDINGYFGIAFKDGFAQKDAALKAFKALPNK